MGLIICSYYRSDDLCLINILEKIKYWFQIGPEKDFNMVLDLCYFFLNDIYISIMRADLLLLIVSLLAGVKRLQHTDDQTYNRRKNLN